MLAADKENFYQQPALDTFVLIKLKNIERAMESASLNEGVKALNLLLKGRVEKKKNE